MKARLGLIGTMLVLPASLGLGLTVSAPSFAAPDCAPGTHRVFSGTESYCAPDENAPDQSTPVPSTPAPAPSEEPAPPLPTVAPPATDAPKPSPSNSPTEDTSVTAPTATGSPTGTAVPTTAPSVKVEEPSTGSAPGSDEAPDAPAVPPAGSGNFIPGTSEFGGAPQKAPAEADVSSEQAPEAEVEQSVVAEKDDKVWALVGLILTVALIIGIIIASVKKLGSPFKKENWHF